MRGNGDEGLEFGFSCRFVNRFTGRWAEIIETYITHDEVVIISHMHSVQMRLIWWELAGWVIVGDRGTEPWDMRVALHL